MYINFLSEYANVINSINTSPHLLITLKSKYRRTDSCASSHRGLEKVVGSALITAVKWQSQDESSLSGPKGHDPPCQEA